MRRHVDAAAQANSSLRRHQRPEAATTLSSTGLGSPARELDLLAGPGFSLTTQICRDCPRSPVARRVSWLRWIAPRSRVTMMAPRVSRTRQWLRLKGMTKVTAQMSISLDGRYARPVDRSSSRPARAARAAYRAGGA